MSLEFNIDQLLAQRRLPKAYVVQCDVCGRIGSVSADRGAVWQAAAEHSAETGHDVRAATVRAGGKRRGSGMAKRGGKRRHGKWVKRFRPAASDHDTYTFTGGWGVHSDVRYEPSQGGWVAHVYQDGQWQGTSTEAFGTSQAAMKDGEHLVAHVEHFAQKGQKPARPWGQYESQKRLRAGGKRRMAPAWPPGKRERTKLQPIYMVETSRNSGCPICKKRIEYGAQCVGVVGRGAQSGMLADYHPRCAQLCGIGWAAPPVPVPNWWHSERAGGKRRKALR